MFLDDGTLKRSLFNMIIFFILWNHGVHGVVDCQETPDDPQCCPMEPASYGEPECFIKGLFGAGSRKTCGVACERIYKRIKENCECDERYGKHFRWEEMGKACDPRGIYHCIPKELPSEEEKRIQSLEADVLRAQDEIDEFEEHYATRDPDDPVGIQELDKDMQEKRDTLTKAKNKLEIARGNDPGGLTNTDALVAAENADSSSTGTIVGVVCVAIIILTCYLYRRRKLSKRKKLMTAEDTYREKRKRTKGDREPLKSENTTPRGGAADGMHTPLGGATPTNFGASSAGGPPPPNMGRPRRPSMDAPQAAPQAGIGRSRGGPPPGAPPGRGRPPPPPNLDGVGGNRPPMAPGGRNRSPRNAGAPLDASWGSQASMPPPLSASFNDRRGSNPAAVPPIPSRSRNNSRSPRAADSRPSKGASGPNSFPPPPPPPSNTGGPRLKSTSPRNASASGVPLPPARHRFN